MFFIIIKIIKDIVMNMSNNINNFVVDNKFLLL